MNVPLSVVPQSCIHSLCNVIFTTECCNKCCKRCFWWRWTFRVFAYWCSGCMCQLEGVTSSQPPYCLWHPSIRTTLGSSLTCPHRFPFWESWAHMLGISLYETYGWGFCVTKFLCVLCSSVALSKSQEKYLRVLQMTLTTCYCETCFNIFQRWPPLSVPNELLLGWDSVTDAWNLVPSEMYILPHLSSICNPEGCWQLQ